MPSCLILPLDGIGQNMFLVELTRLFFDVIGLEIRKFCFLRQIRQLGKILAIRQDFGNLAIL